MKILLYLSTVAMMACLSSNNNKTENTTVKAGIGLVAETEMTMAENFYDFEVNDIDGNPVDFSKFKGQKLLIVNVASKCGYTPQYAELQELYEKYKGKLNILAFPANNFGGQEPGTNEDIKAFCSDNYGVTFPIFEKISVKGADKHPLYRWLSDKEMNGWNNTEPSWNFCKYFINEEGELIKFFPSSVKPMDDEIIALINA